MKHFMRSWAARIRHALRKDGGCEESYWRDMLLKDLEKADALEHLLGTVRYAYRSGMWHGADTAKRIYREMENEEYEV